MARITETIENIQFNEYGQLTFWNRLYYYNNEVWNKYVITNATFMEVMNYIHERNIVVM